MPNYKLTYFAVRARGEKIRLMFHLAGVPFEDEQVTFDQWATKKSKTKFGQLPVLTIDGKEYTESSAIERYVAREFGLYGSNNQEAYIIDQILGICGDMFEKQVKFFFQKDEKEKEKLCKDFNENQKIRYVGNIEELLKAKGCKNCCVGGKLSLGDIAIFNIVDGRLTDAELDKFKFDTVKAIVQNVRENPNIKRYLASRPNADI